MNENPHVEATKDVDDTVSLLVEELVKNSINPSKDSGNEAKEAPSSSTCQTVEIYRALGHFNSESDVDVSLCVRRINELLTSRGLMQQPPWPASEQRMPPSYSTVIKEARPTYTIRRDVRSMELQHISPFSRIPPPSYAQVQGAWSQEPSNVSSEQVLFGPDPLYVWCSRCATVVISHTRSQHSRFTHMVALAMCLLGCWPCAVLPYYMDSCKNIYHFCPDCNYLFGIYRPW